MTFIIKKRINTELFIDRMAVLYIGKTRMRVRGNEGDQPVALADWSGANEFKGNVKETEDCFLRYFEIKTKKIISNSYKMSNITF